jgi:hypothetical protein
MSGESIALAKHLDLDKMSFPAWFSEKLDGVPIHMTIECNAGEWRVSMVTRQWEPALSCINYGIRFVQYNQDVLQIGRQYHFVFEVTHETLTGFKDISGVVRRQSHQEGLVFNLFDYDAFMPHVKNSGRGFGDRMNECMHDFQMPPSFHTIHQVLYPDAESLQDALDNTPIGLKQEGWIIRAADAVWKPGTRHWDYQKVVKEPTIDLWIVSASEGTGKFAGGVGRFEAAYRGATIGIGPGKQTTAERAAALHGKYPRMACIKYKPDDGYEALRQPTFQCWRDDKSEADA